MDKSFSFRRRWKTGCPPILRRAFCVNSPASWICRPGDLRCGRGGGHHRDCPVRAHCTRDPKAGGFKSGRMRPWSKPCASGCKRRPRRLNSRNAVKLLNRASRSSNNMTASGTDGLGPGGGQNQWSLLGTTLNLRGFFKKWPQGRAGNQISIKSRSTSARDFRSQP
jgi:hypothetical protein